MKIFDDGPHRPAAIILSSIFGIGFIIKLLQYLDIIQLGTNDKYTNFTLTIILGIFSLICMIPIKWERMKWAHVFVVWMLGNLGYLYEVRSLTGICMQILTIFMLIAYDFYVKQRTLRTVITIVQFFGVIVASVLMHLQRADEGMTTSFVTITMGLLILVLFYRKVFPVRVVYKEAKKPELSLASHGLDAVEQMIIRHTAEGRTPKEIHFEIQKIYPTVTSMSTVYTYRRIAAQKLGFESVDDFIARARDYKLI